MPRAGAAQWVGRSVKFHIDGNSIVPEMIGFERYLQKLKILDKVNMVAEPWSSPQGTLGVPAQQK